MSRSSSVQSDEIQSLYKKYIHGLVRLVIFRENYIRTSYEDQYTDFQLSLEEMNLETELKQIADKINNLD